MSHGGWGALKRRNLVRRGELEPFVVTTTLPEALEESGLETFFRDNEVQRNDV